MKYVPRSAVARELWTVHMQPHGRTVCQVATLCDLSCQEIVDLLYDRVEMTPERAVALADGLDTTAEFWLQLSESLDVPE